MLPQAGDFRVVCTPDGQLPYMLVGPAATPVEPVRDYLLELFASDCSLLTIKSYAFDLLDWFRFLVNVGASWDQLSVGTSAIGCWKRRSKSILSATTVLTGHLPVA